MRTSFDPLALGSGFYSVLTAVVVPRPIAWVSTRSVEGVDNLAPHSFFTVACVRPAMVQFTSVGRKDSLRNVESTGQFVVNLAPEPLFEAVNATGADFPPEVSELDAVGLTRRSSEKVLPPGVAESPVSIECELHATICLGDSTIVIGRVVWASVDDEALVGGHPDVGRLRPLSRLGRDEWGTAGQVRSVPRISYTDWQQRSGGH